MPAAHEHPPASGDDPCRVLCVDDDPVTQRILVGALARPGYAVECVCDGQEAIERFASDPRGFDVLVTDHWMPRIDGLGLVRTLRGLGFHGTAVVVSASLMPDDRAAYRHLGVSVLLDKPVDIGVLRGAVDAAPRLPAAERSSVHVRMSKPPFGP